MTPETVRRLDLACLAEHTLKSLGVNDTDQPTAELVIDHAVAQACIELEMVENILESDPKHGCLAYVLACIRERLELARECNETLANLLADGSESDIIKGLGEVAS